MYQYVIGDSNSDNTFLTPPASFYTGQIVPGAEPLYDGASDRADIIGNLVALGRAYASQVFNPSSMILLQSAVGGASIGQWNSTYFARAQAAVTNITILRPNSSVSMITWIQGEADCVGGGTPASVYNTSLIDVIWNFRSNYNGTNSTTPFVLGSMVPEWVATGGYTSHAGPIEDVHRAIPNFVPYTAWVNMPLGYVDCYENIHYSATGQRMLGQMWIDGYKRAMNNTQGGMIPNHPTGLSVSNSGSLFTLTWTAPLVNPTAPVSNYQIVYRIYINTGNPGVTCADGDPTPPIRFLINSTSPSYSFTLPIQYTYQFDVCAVSGGQISSGHTIHGLSIKRVYHPHPRRPHPRHRHHPHHQVFVYMARLSFLLL